MTRLPKLLIDARVIGAMLDCLLGNRGGRRRWRYALLIWRADASHFVSNAEPSEARKWLLDHVPGAAPKERVPVDVDTALAAEARSNELRRQHGLPAPRGGQP